jgi:serine phosphatase RsbU (regulator of sigma subunit)
MTASQRSLSLTLLGAAIVCGVAVYDAVVGPGQSVTGVVLVGPIVVAVAGEPRGTGLVAAFAWLLVLLSPAWDTNLSSSEYWFRVTFVALGGAVLYLAARGRRAERELSQANEERAEVAQLLEMAIVPAAPPRVPGWQLAALYRPASGAARVGGDFYDVYRIGGAWMVVVGDVVGHGPQAAAMTALVRYTLRAAATLTGSAEAAVTKLHEDLRRRGRLETCGITCAVLPDGPAGEVGVLCAGSPRPLLVRAGAAAEVGRHGPLIGAFRSAGGGIETVTMLPGEILLLYSDGLPDLTGPDERFGSERLLRALAPAHDADDAVRRLLDAIDSFAAGADQVDDAIAMAIEFTGAARPRISDRGRAAGPAPADL